MLQKLLTFILVLTASSLPNQQQLAENLAAKAAMSEIKYDEEGRVISLFFSNHKNNEKKNPGPEGITDVDMALIPQFSHLKSFKIERQMVSTAGVQHLKQCPKIESLAFHYMAHKFDGLKQFDKIDPEFMLVANHFRDQLHTLEIKHNFKLKETAVEKLQAMPKLKRLVLDNASAASSAVSFINSCPLIEDLELHRTTIKGPEMEQIVTALPHLKILWIRPDNGNYEDKIDFRIMKHLAGLNYLEELMLKLNFGPIPYEDGYQHLTQLPNLRKLIVNGDVDPQDTGLRKFMELCPEVEVVVGYQKI